MAFTTLRLDALFHFVFTFGVLTLVWPTDRLINLGGGRGAARSTTELTLFLLGKGGGNPTGPVDDGSGLGGGEGGHWEEEGSPGDLSGLLLDPRNRLACHERLVI